MQKSYPLKAILFDLDGVLVSTDKYHYEAWKKIADSEGIPFDHTINNRLRGVSRMECLDILLEKSSREYSNSEKSLIANRKNEYFNDLIATLSEEDWLPGALQFVKEAIDKGVRIAVCSSSKNARKILECLGGTDLFQDIIDGNAISRTKPDPQIFLFGAKSLGVSSSECIVFEDAKSGVEAAKKAGMRCVGIGDPEELVFADKVISGFDDMYMCDFFIKHEYSNSLR